MLWIFAAFIAGGYLLAMGLCFAAGRADRWSENFAGGDDFPTLGVVDPYEPADDEEDDWEDDSDIEVDLSELGNPLATFFRGLVNVNHVACNDRQI